MAVVGRVLQVLGWLWVVVGVFGPMVDFPDISWFPGLILVFVSRILRVQASRTAQGGDEQSEETPIPNVERPPDPPRAERRPAPAPPKPPPVVPEPSREEIEQRLLASMNERVGSKDDVDVDVEELRTEVDDTGTPKSSAEMIAEARQRWNKRP